MVDILKRVGWIFLLLLPLAIINVVLSNVPKITPVAFHPEKSPEFTGRLATNKILSSADALLKGQVSGPEDIALDDDGNIYISNADGNILVLRTNGELDTLVSTLGRPLGLAFAPSGDLIVCHEPMGLISVDDTGNITRLAGNDEGIHLADDLAVSSDGIVYFSDATIFEDLNSFYYDILIHQPFGRVFSYNLNSGILELIVDSLYFANGIAISPEEDYLLIAETAAYKIRKYWLKGEHAGTDKIIADNLSGFPDGIIGNGNGEYWISMASPRKWSVDHLYHPYVWVKQILKYLPEILRPGPDKYGLIIKIDGDGNILESLHDPDGTVLHTITNVVEWNNALYMGSLYNDTVGKLILQNNPLPHNKR